MSVIEITTSEQFDDLLKSTPFVAIQAGASWSGPSRAISPIFEDIARTKTISNKYVFARFDTDEVADLAESLRIRSIPVFYFFQDGDMIETCNGANPESIQELANQLSQLASEQAGSA